jgi:hypothetical protein
MVKYWWNERIFLLKCPPVDGEAGFLEEFSNTPQGGTLFSAPLRGISTFTKFIHTLFNTPLRGEKQEMNF